MSPISDRTLSAAQQRDENARIRFEADTAKHEMKIVHDEGLYRHVRFSQPEHSWSYWFDIITWPGCLTITGDCGTFTFSRIRDMFDFFVGPDRSGINPHYWAEKLRGCDDGRRPAMKHSFEAYCAWVTEWRDNIQDWTGDELTEPERLEFHAAVREQLLDDEDAEAEHDPQECHRRLRDFSWRNIQISDSWELSFDEYDWSFLWCCWAIVRGIERYQAAKATPSPAPTSVYGEHFAMAIAAIRKLPPSERSAIANRTAVSR